MQLNNVGFGVCGLYVAASMALKDASMSATAQYRRVGEIAIRGVWIPASKPEWWIRHFRRPDRHRRTPFPPPRPQATHRHARSLLSGRKGPSFRAVEE